MLKLAWQFRATCLAVLILNLLLVSFNLSGLQLAGLGVDVLRKVFQADSPVPHWPFGLTPPTDWTPMMQVALVAALVLVCLLYTSPSPRD